MKPDTIIIHCSATREDRSYTAAQLDADHKARGFRRPDQTQPLKHIGYHYYIRRSGEIITGRHENEQGAHCLGWNNRSIGICYEGGLSATGKPKDTRTPQQKQAINQLVNQISTRHTITSIIGHRDTSPDLNGNGKIDPHERIKECPCYDVKEEYPNHLPQITITP